MWERSRWRGEKVLTNLLPGLRDLRAPLSAGVIWLFAIWLAVEPELPPEGHAEGVLASVAALKDELSMVGLGAALTFLAYLLGSLAEGILTVLGNLWSRSMGGLLRWYLARRERRLLRNSARVRQWQTRYGWAPNPRPRLSDEALSAIHDLAENEVHVAREKLLGRDSQESDVIPVEYDLSNDVAAWWNGVGKLGDHHADIGDDLMAAEVARRTVGEFEQMRTRLLIDLPNLFSNVDRLRAEAEFRRAVGPALVGLAVVLAWRGPAWSALLTFLAATVLLYQGGQRERQSNDALVEALRNGRITSPSMDRLREDVTKEEQQPRQRETPEPQSPAA